MEFLYGFIKFEINTFCLAFLYLFIYLFKLVSKRIVN